MELRSELLPGNVWGAPPGAQTRRPALGPRPLRPSNLTPSPTTVLPGPQLPKLGPRLQLHPRGARLPGSGPLRAPPISPRSGPAHSALYPAAPRPLSPELSPAPASTPSFPGSGPAPQPHGLLCSRAKGPGCWELLTQRNETRPWRPTPTPFSQENWRLAPGDVGGATAPAPPFFCSENIPLLQPSQPGVCGYCFRLRFGTVTPNMQP